MGNNSEGLKQYWATIHTIAQRNNISIKDARTEYKLRSYQSKVNQQQEKKTQQNTPKEDTRFFRYQYARAIRYVGASFVGKTFRAEVVVKGKRDTPTMLKALRIRLQNWVHNQPASVQKLYAQSEYEAREDEEIGDNDKAYVQLNRVKFFLEAD